MKNIKFMILIILYIFLLSSILFSQQDIQFNNSFYTSKNLIPGDQFWDSIFVVNNAPNGPVFAIVAHGQDIYIGGKFTKVGTMAANNIAKWDGAKWITLGTGINDYVNAIAIDSNIVYAGGNFTQAGGISANKIAKWDGNIWSALGNGLTNPVKALLASSGFLYVGQSVGGPTPSSYIKIWNGNDWNVLGNDKINGSVYALTMFGSDLYIGGNFTMAGKTRANNIAKWNGSDWSSLGNGLTINGIIGTGNVFALTAGGSDIYAGGKFNLTGNQLNNIAKWDGSSWSPLGTGVNGTVYALSAIGSDIIVGGDFLKADTITVNRIAKWKNNIWSNLGNGHNNYVRAIETNGSDIFSAGYFTTSGNKSSNYFGRWNDTLGTTSNKPIIVLDRDTIVFSSYSTGPLPTSILVKISNGGKGTLNWSARADSNWLDVFPTNGTDSGIITVSINKTTLFPGTYKASIVISAANASNSPKNIDITYILKEGPVIGVIPDSLTFYVQEGMPLPPNQTIVINNLGKGTMDWKVSKEHSWDTYWDATSSSGTNNGTISINVTNNCTAWKGKIIITSPFATNSPKIVPITILLKPGPIVSTNKDTLFFTADQNGTLPVPDSIAISNTGVGTLNWNTLANEYPTKNIYKQLTWLDLSPKTGTNSGKLKASINTTSLFPGTYRGYINISGCLAEKDILVIYKVTAPGSIVYSNIKFYDKVKPDTTNPNNFIGPGRYTKFKLQIKNGLSFKTANDSGEIKIDTSYRNYVSLLDKFSTFDSIDIGKTGWSKNEFGIFFRDTILPNPQKVKLTLTITRQTAPKGPFTSVLEFPIPPILQPGIIIIDDDSLPESKGNNNKIIEKGETIELIPYLNNLFSEEIRDPKAKFTTKDTSIKIWNSTYPSNNTTIKDTIIYNYPAVFPLQTDLKPDKKFVFDFKSNDSLARFDLEIYGYWVSDSLVLMKWTAPMNLKIKKIVVLNKLIQKNFNQSFLFQNYPNPFNPMTTLELFVSQPGKVSIKIFNTFGQEVKTLLDENLTSGIYKINWNAGNLPSGTYFYQMRMDNYFCIRKLVLLK